MSESGSSSDVPLSKLAPTTSKGDRSSDSDSDNVNLASLTPKKQTPAKKPKRKVATKKRKKPTSSDSDDSKPLAAKTVNPSLKISRQPRKLPTEKTAAKRPKVQESSSDSDESDSEKKKEDEEKQSTEGEKEVETEEKDEAPAATTSNGPSAEKTDSGDEEKKKEKSPGDESGDTSDTSIIDKDEVKSSPKKENKEEEDDGDEKKQKEKKKSKKADSEHPRIVKLKRYISTAGLRCNYKQLFADVQTKKARIAKLEEFLNSHGLTGKLTLESCKSFRLQKAQQKELADLDTSNIISGGRVLRSQAPKKRGRKVLVWSSDEEKSERSDESAAEARRGCEEMRSRLKGIVDSDGSDDD